MNKSRRSKQALADPIGSLEGKSEVTSLSALNHYRVVDARFQLLVCWERKRFLGVDALVRNKSKETNANILILLNLSLSHKFVEQNFILTATTRLLQISLLAYLNPGFRRWCPRRMCFHSKKDKVNSVRPESILGPRDRWIFHLVLQSLLLTFNNNWWMCFSSTRVSCIKLTILGFFLFPNSSGLQT